MTEVAPSLEDIRAKLDAIDTQILALVDERAQLAGSVAAAKRARGEGDSFALRPGRESQILRRPTQDFRRNRVAFFGDGSYDPGQPRYP